MIQILRSFYDPTRPPRITTNVNVKQESHEEKRVSPGDGNKPFKQISRTEGWSPRVPGHYRYPIPPEGIMNSFEFY